MAMTIGTAAADQGMAKDIFTQVDVLLAPPLQKAIDDADGDAKAVAQDALDTARKNWRQLAFAIASGVITHLTEHMEITGIQTTGSVAATVSGATQPAPGPGPHVHPVALTASQPSVTFDQTGATLGHVG